MQDPLDARALLKAYGISPKKQLGQNFLVKKSALNKILEAAELEAKETVLEIGAGLGALTLEVARRQHNVVAIEYDARLIPILESVLRDHSNTQIIHGDILQLDLSEVIQVQPYSVVANIPYQITSAVIRKLMESPLPAKKVVLTIQREVAERIVAESGDLSLLALSVQIFGQPKICVHLPPKVFYPQPKVESSVLRVDMFTQPRIPMEQLDDFFRIAKAGFSQKRKQLRNSLAAGLHLTPRDVGDRMHNAEINPTRRAQELGIEDWKRLCNQFSKVESD